MKYKQKDEFVTPTTNEFPGLLESCRLCWLCKFYGHSVSLVSVSHVWNYVEKYNASLNLYLEQHQKVCLVEFCIIPSV